MASINMFGRELLIGIIFTLMFLIWKKNLFGRGLSFVIITFNLHCRFILSCIQRMLTYGFLHFLCLEEYEHMFV